MDYKIRDSEEGGYRIIELSENTKMSLRVINNVINLSSVECDIPELKGICFKEFMKILVKTAKNGELFGKRFGSQTMVVMTASLCVINKTVNNGDVSKCVGKSKSTKSITKSYMSSTASSRLKQRSAKGKKTRRKRRTRKSI